VPNPLEVAKLVVRGQEYTEWETVTVVANWIESRSTFTFTATEISTTPARLNELKQFVPGDPVEIFLAGKQIIEGYITQRQAAYAARQHGVQLIGHTLSYLLDKDSISTDTGSFDGSTLVAIAKAVAGDSGVDVRTVGNVDGKPFKQVQVQPGQLKWEFLEELARNKSVVLGSDQQGNLLLIGDHGESPEGEVVEGKNILRAQCLITNELAYNEVTVFGSQPGHDDEWGKDVSEQKAKAHGNDPLPSKRGIVMEHPDSPEMVQKRATHEARWASGTMIDASVTVQGWINDHTGDLWRPGRVVTVVSPMLMLNDPLGIKTATFHQSMGAGTTTTLELVLAFMLNIDNAPVPGFARPE